jgi:hypothetical protein
MAAAAYFVPVVTAQVFELVKFQVSGLREFTARDFRHYFILAAPEAGAILRIGYRPAVPNIQTLSAQLKSALLVQRVPALLRRKLANVTSTVLFKPIGCSGAAGTDGSCSAGCIACSSAGKTAGITFLTLSTLFSLLILRVLTAFFMVNSFMNSYMKPAIKPVYKSAALKRLLPERKVLFFKTFLL